MIGTIEQIVYEQERALNIKLRFPPPRNSTTGEDIIKEITMCECIGQGSYGTVYRALCEDYPRLAVKVATGRSNRLKQELSVLSKVCTQGRLLLPRFEFGALNKTGDLIVIGMELCVPRTLHELLLSTKLTSEADMLYIAHQCALTVSHVHEQGCIHRDIKLQNYVFDLNGNIKLIDFGLSCDSLQPPPGDVVAGTVSFMSPEMAHNALYRDKRVSVGAAADIWSLGIVLFSIFTQRNPYPTNGGNNSSDSSFKDSDDNDSEERSNKKLLKRVATGKWSWPQDCLLSSELRHMVSVILHPDPNKRPTIEEILRSKTWNLRRKSPPAALTAFLGVQDDFFLSHDEEHLMRAVESRSAGVAASMLKNQQLEPVQDEVSQSEALRQEGSLKVVERDEYAVEGVPGLQVYDVRASNRKRAKPIREISQVIEEHAKEKSKSRRGTRNKAGNKSRNENGNETSRDTSVHSNRNDHNHGKRVNGNDAVDSGELVKARASRSVTPTYEPVELFGNTQKDRRGGSADDNSRSQTVANPADISTDKKSAASRDRNTTSSVEASRVSNSTGTNVKKEKKSRAASEELVKDSILKTESKNVLRQRSSSILGNYDKNRVPLEDKKNSTASQKVEKKSTVKVKKQAPPARTARAKTVKEKVDPDSISVTPPKGVQGFVFENNINMLLEEEIRQRKFLTSLLLIEQANLLEYLFLRLNEDAEYYSITWLQEEQAKSAAHEHVFTHITNVSKYKNYHEGFVCDMCDYDYLPVGKDKMTLHFFHCVCGRDLCEDCYKEYKKKCTCDCCNKQHPNSCALRDHLVQMRKIKDKLARTTTTKEAPAAQQTALQKKRRRNSPSPSPPPRRTISVSPPRQTETKNSKAGKPSKANVATTTTTVAAAATSIRKASAKNTATKKLSPETPAASRQMSPLKRSGNAVKKQPNNKKLKREKIKEEEEKDEAESYVDDEEEEEEEMKRAGGRKGKKEKNLLSNPGTMHMSVAAMAQTSVPPKRRGSSSRLKAVDKIPEGPWRPLANMRSERIVTKLDNKPTLEEREALLHGEWIRHFYYYPADTDEVYSLVYHAQPGRTGALFLSTDFGIHSAILSPLERQLFVVGQTDMSEGNDVTEVYSLIQARANRDVNVLFQEMQEVTTHDTNMMKQHQTPMRVAVYQTARSAYNCNGDPYLYIRWFRSNADGSFFVFLLSNGAVQAFVKNEYEIRWFDEHRKFIIRPNGVCEKIDDEKFALGPELNKLLYDSII